jgi:mitochondrial fission protein ELM1
LRWLDELFFCRNAAAIVEYGQSVVIKTLIVERYFLKILIIDDGKAGHVQQSQVIATIIMQCMGLLGKKVPIIDFINVNISKVNRLFLEGLLDYLPTLSRIIGHYACREVSAIEKLTPDIIISCGKSASIVGALCGGGDCVKICILYPGQYAIKKFDLLITPNHDAGKLTEHPNVIKTNLALYLSNAIEGKLSAGHIGILLGGNNRSYSYNRDVCQQIAKQLVQLKKRSGAQLHWTASRRTSKHLLHAMDREFQCAGQEHHKLEDINELFSICDWIIVSADSISMISQAVVNGCKVTVFSPPSRMISTGKHDRFVETLAANGSVVTCSFDEIALQKAPRSNEAGLRLHQADMELLKSNIEDILRAHAFL